MRKSKFHLYHISYLNELFKGLKSNGVSTQKIIDKSLIRQFNLNDENIYLPQEVYYEFLRNVKRKEGVDIAGEFYGGFRLNTLGEYGAYLSKSKNLYEVLKEAIRLDPLSQTNSKMKLEIVGPVSIFSLQHVDKPSKGRIISEKIELGMMLKGMQHVLGFNWNPIEIQLTSNRADWLYSHLQNLNCSIKFNCNRIAILFKTDELTIKNPTALKEKSINPFNFSTNLKVFQKCIESMDYGFIPTVDHLANFFMCSRRTIFREFKKSGQTYNELMKAVLFTRSLELLQNKSLNIIEISEVLGYDNPANFIRAFKSWTGTTPHKYRMLN